VIARLSMPASELCHVQVYDDAVAWLGDMVRRTNNN
jgi:hypothetical protein